MLLTVFPPGFNHKSLFFILAIILLSFDLSAQRLDTLVYVNMGQADSRLIPYDNTKSLKESIRAICQLEDDKFDSLNFSFQILKDGSITDLKITGDLSNYDSETLENDLKSVRLFKSIPYFQVTYVEIYCIGKKIKERKIDISKEASPTPSSFSGKNYQRIQDLVSANARTQFLTTNENSRVYLQSTTYPKQPINNLKIIRGINPMLDYLVASWIADTIFNNKDFTPLPELARGKLRPTTVVFPVNLPAIVEDGLVLPFKRLTNPQYRLRKKTYYYGRYATALAFKDIIYDSALIKESEWLYDYDDQNRVSQIHVSINEPAAAYRDTIIYHKMDSVTVIQLPTGKLSTRMLFDYSFYLEKLKWSRLFEYRISENIKYEFKKSDGKIEQIQYLVVRNKSDNVFYLSSNSAFQYNNDGTKIVSGLLTSNLENKDRTLRTNLKFDYFNDGYQITTSDEYLVSTNAYFFNEDGYVIANVYESDTFPHIIRYEYEPGWGNASFFENNYFDLLNLIPIIY